MCQNGKTASAELTDYGKLRDAGLAALEDENTVEARGVAMLEGASGCDGIVGAGHEETVLDDDEPQLVARVIVVGHLGVLILNSLGDAVDGEGLNVR